jgi:mannose-6-phosphate isomerase-like protein (cupin superfamily)
MADIVFGVVDAPVFVRRDARGVFEELLNTGHWQSCIHGVMVAGSEIGHHYHAYTVVAYFLLEGRARITTLDVTSSERQEVEIQAGQGFIFRPSQVRVVHHLENVRYLLLKSHAFDHARPDLIAYRID